MSNQKLKRMTRIFRIQSRKEEQLRAGVAEARRRVEHDRAELAAADAQLEALATDAVDAASMRFGRLLVESGMLASQHRREQLDASLADLEVEFNAWQLERKRASSLEKVVDRLADEVAAERAKSDEAELEELAMVRRARADA